MRLVTWRAAARAARAAIDGPRSAGPAPPDPAAEDAPDGPAMRGGADSWPLRRVVAPAGRASLMRGRLRGPQVRRARGAERVDLGEEAQEQPAGQIGPLDLGHVAAAVEHDLLGRRQPVGDVALERGGD